VALRAAVAHCLKRGILATDPIQDSVAAVSVGLIDGKILLDLSYEEDSRADVDMNFVMTGSGKFVEIQGTAESAPFTNKQMERMTQIAQDGIRELIKAQTQVLASIR
jgi:ribonuclease PH